MVTTIPYGKMRNTLDILFNQGTIADYEWATEPTTDLPHDIIHITSHDGRVMTVCENCLNPRLPIDWITYPNMNEVGTKHTISRGYVKLAYLHETITEWAEA